MANTNVTSTLEWDIHDAREKAEKESARHVKRRRLKLSPELTDGDHFAIVTSYRDIDLSAFWGGAEVGQMATITLVEMTDAEVEALTDT
jgi:hypothetical protein